jgi:hypothetical protein
MPHERLSFGKRLCKSFITGRRHNVDITKLIPAKVKGGRKRNPTFIANQVDPQTEQSETKTRMENHCECFGKHNPFLSIEYVAEQIPHCN